MESLFKCFLVSQERKVPALELYSHESYELTKKIVKIHSVKFSVGRDSSCSFVIPDERISNLHCTFERVKNLWYITDESDKGVTVNGDVLIFDVRKKINEGDLICLASPKYIYRFVFLKEDNDDGDSVSLDLGSNFEYEANCCDWNCCCCDGDCCDSCSVSCCSD